MGWIVAEHVGGVRFLFPDDQVVAMSHHEGNGTDEDRVTILMTNPLLSRPGFQFGSTMGVKWVEWVDNMPRALLLLRTGGK